MTKHTAGPWKSALTFVANENPTHGIYAKSDDPRRFNGELVATGANEADARLIAAAPDMLAALEAIVEAGRMSDSTRAVYCADIARAAIAKATGE